MPKNDSTIRFPTNQIDAFGDVMDDAASGKPVDPNKLRAAMPVVQAVQHVIDHGTPGTAVIMAPQDGDK